MEDYVPNQPEHKLGRQIEKDVCKVFGCGKNLTLYQSLFGDFCPEHSKSKKTKNKDKIITSFVYLLPNKKQSTMSMTDSFFRSKWFNRHVPNEYRAKMSAAIKQWDVQNPGMAGTYSEHVLDGLLLFVKGEVAPPLPSSINLPIKEEIKTLK